MTSSNRNALGTVLYPVIRKLPWYLAAPNRASIGAIRRDTIHQACSRKQRGVAGDAPGDDHPRVAVPGQGCGANRSDAGGVLLAGTDRSAGLRHGLRPDD